MILEIMDFGIRFTTEWRSFNNRRTSRSLSEIMAEKVGTTQSKKTLA